MSVNKKRRRLPEEDLEAAVADIINSPITRSNLSFLRPLGTSPEPTGVDTEPMGDDTQPMVYGSIPAPSPDLQPKGVNITPLGDETTPAGVARQKETVVTSVRPLWQAEGLGALFDANRVRRITRAQDALSAVEEKVYNLLWGSNNQESDNFRLVHYSLQRISSEAHINIKTVRELIPRLIEKGFIRIEHEADVRRGIPTLYRVLSASSILDDQKQRDRLYVAKSGKGIFYVHPGSASFHSQASGNSEPLGVTTNPTGLPDGFEPLPVGVALPTSGVSSKPPGSDVLTPMGSEQGLPEREGGHARPSSTMLAHLIAIIHTALGLQPDDQLLHNMIETCHRNSVETTKEPASDEEILYFTSTKAAALARAANIRNHLAVLRRAVPECFLGESFRAYRAAADSRKL